MYFKFLIVFLVAGFSIYDLSAQCITGDCSNGWGKFKDDKGRTYEGHFLEGQRSGKGTFFYTNGDRYEGDWENGLPHGYGIRYAADGSAKGGKWERGQLVEANKKIRAALECLGGDCVDGYGHSVDAKGRSYKGDFKNGLYHGAGELRYPSGDRYTGNWAKGLPHGAGAYYYSNGHVDSGEWVYGKIKNDKLKVWALVVGVADYTNFPKLTYTTQDARKVYGFLRSLEGGAVPEEQIELLLDEDATMFNIQNALADISEQADSSDLIIFYFAGHGKEGGFLPYDYDGERGNILHHGVINTILMDSPAKYKLCVADACHSGSYSISYDDYIEHGKEFPASDTRTTKTVREKIKAFYKSFDNVKGGLAIIMSSASEEISLESNKLEQGVFSYYFIEGLKGRADLNSNSIVTVNELFYYIEKQVQRTTYKFQNPLIHGEYDDNMPVGLLFKE